MNKPKPLKISFGRYRLESIVAFLEMDFETIASDENLPPLQSEMIGVARDLWPPRGKPLKFGERVNWRRGAKKVQAELRQDLRQVVSTTAGPDHDSVVGRFIDKIGRANKNAGLTMMIDSPRMPVKTLKNLPRFRKSNPIGRQLELWSKDGGEFLSGGNIYTLSWSSGLSLRDFVYFQLGRAIEERCFEDLKSCRQCGKLFVATKHNAINCSPRCKDAFNYEERKKPKANWDGLPYYHFIRAIKRKGQIAQARRLLKAGSPILHVIEETGLSKRLLCKAGLI